MKHIQNVHGNGIPQSIRILNNEIVIASNIHEYTETTDGIEINGYQYDCDVYPKDEYLILIAQQANKIAELEDQLAAAKILLGVE